MKQDQLLKIKPVLAGLIFGGLFYLGYHYIESLNSEPNQSQIQKAPTVIAPQKQEYRLEDPLLEIKLTRDRQRSREIELIQVFLEKQNLTAEVRKQAEQELWRLTQAVAKESELESLLKANGFKDILATISPNLVTIVIAERIQAQQVRLVGQMAAEITACPIDRIQIVKREN